MLLIFSHFVRSYILQITQLLNHQSYEAVRLAPPPEKCEWDLNLSALSPPLTHICSPGMFLTNIILQQILCLSFLGIWWPLLRVSKSYSRNISLGSYSMTNFCLHKCTLITAIKRIQNHVSSWFLSQFLWNWHIHFQYWSSRWATSEKNITKESCLQDIHFSWNLATETRVVIWKGFAGS